MKTKTITTIILGILLLGLANISALTISDVSTSPNQVAPGADIDLIIEIENNLGDKAEDIEISLDLSNVPLAPRESSEKYLDKLKDDDEESFKFSLIAEADAEAGIYKIPVTIKYTIDDEEKTEKTKNFTVSVNINARPDFIISAEGLFLKNQKNELEIQIINIGLSKAKLLEIELQPSGAYEILSSNRVYIGDLDSDDFDVAKFDIFLKGAGVVSFPLKLRYRDAANKQFSDSEVVSIKVYSQKEAAGLGLIEKSNVRLYFYIALGVVVVWFFWRRHKKRKKIRGV